MLLVYRKVSEGTNGFDFLLMLGFCVLDSKYSLLDMQLQELYITVFTPKSIGHAILTTDQYLWAHLLSTGSTLRLHFLKKQSWNESGWKTCLHCFMTKGICSSLPVPNVKKKNSFRLIQFFFFNMKPKKYSKHFKSGLGFCVCVNIF